MSQGFQDFGTQNPYPTPPTFGVPPQKKSNTIWIVLALLLFGGVAICGCCGGIVYFGFGVLSTEIANELRDNPTLREHVGEIQSFDVNFVASAAEEDEDAYVYEVVGDKGSGTVTVKSITDDEGNEEIIWARLRTPDGTTVELVSE